MIKVLIVEDSYTTQCFLSQVLNSDPELTVIGTASDGIAALEFLKHQKPDVITMDFFMPRMNGLEVTRRIMETEPVPIVIVSAFTEQQDKVKVFQFIDAGAVAVIDKPVGPHHPDFDSTVSRIIQTVKSMSEIKLVRRRPSMKSTNNSLTPVTTQASTQELTKAPVLANTHSDFGKRLTPPSFNEAPVHFGPDVALIAIGASTGGPPVVKTILEGLEPNHPPVIVVQHIARGFLSGLVGWLTKTTNCNVMIAEQDQKLLPGCIYFAPDDFHLIVSNRLTVNLIDQPAIHGLRPSVSHLFRSVAENIGKNAVGVLLTGMGTDGSVELKLLRDSGGITIAQDKESSIVYGMPGEAVKLGGAKYVLPPSKIVETLNSLIKKAVAN